ncbi:hypothetical protein PSAB6_570126 [Paraburkholderia sabiae]|nr:hypothetical protein PSAB6_570126 [Paraburkholderia sabiae]
MAGAPTQVRSLSLTVLAASNGYCMLANDFGKFKAQCNAVEKYEDFLLLT